MEDLVVILLCGVYVVAEAAAGMFLYRRLRWKNEYVRKFIHIMTANLIFPVTYLISGFWTKLVGPAAFIVINASASFLGFGKYLGLDDRKRVDGLVLYPFSVLVLVLLASLGYISQASSVCGVLIMGWGDGMAAIVGTFMGKHRYKVFGRYKKSLEGTAAMAVVTFLTVVFFGRVQPALALVVGIVAAVLENISPSGLDNVTVPVLSALLVEALCNL